MSLQPAREQRPSRLRQSWYEIEPLERGIWAITEPFHNEHVRSHLIVGDERALLIDTGMGVGDLRTVVEELTALPVLVINSHAHWDHIGSNHQFNEIAIHRAEADRLPRGVSNERLRRAFAPEHLFAPLPKGVDIERATIPPSKPTAILAGGERFDLGGRQLEAIHAPGHSPGGIVLLDRADGLLFSTDVAYAGPLYAFGEDADRPTYLRTLDMLAELAPSLRALFPSHNVARIEPPLLIAMRDGLEAIEAGRAPDGRQGEADLHRFNGFSVLVDAAPASRP